MNRTAVDLSVDRLFVDYFTRLGRVRAVNDVSFSLKSGERLGLVGESGSGKSTLALAIMRAHKEPARITSGSILLGDRDLLQLSESQMRDARLRDVAMVPQGAMNSLNPVLKIRDQILDGLIDHGVRLAKQQKRVRVAELLESVGLAAKVANAYPHELSGGMKQRVSIAIAIALSPRVIIADEPTSALDVVVQRQVIQTLKDAQQNVGASAILIGHDIGLMAQFADRLGVMYAGRLVELAPVESIFRSPLHPYTKLLIGSLPDMESKRRLQGVPGLPPSLLEPPEGCLFAPRCPNQFDACSATTPGFLTVDAGHAVACHLHRPKRA